MDITFIDCGYPIPGRAGGDTFVREFVHAMARHGHACSVVSPITLSRRSSFPLPPRTGSEYVDDLSSVKVFRPRHLTFSALRFGPLHTGRWSNWAAMRVAIKQVTCLNPQPRIVYGHFMYPAGYAAARAGAEMGVPSIVGVGEGEFWTLEAVGDEKARHQLKEVSAFLAVSSAIAEELIERLAIPPTKIKVFPNGVNLQVFHPSMGVDAIRDRLQIPTGTFNIGYVGPLIANKGYPQLRAAVLGMENVRLVLLGQCMADQADPQVAFSGKVSHSAVADYLHACDIFVLPTAIEGSCNSVLEAMACGLPIITSNGHYMDDIVDDEVAIRIDPEDVQALREAIRNLKNDPLRRQQMSMCCVTKAGQFDINLRAKRVSAWMESLCASPRAR